jgi:hypothetical protein
MLLYLTPHGAGVMFKECTCELSVTLQTVEEATGRSSQDVLYISRSTECENTARYPDIYIEGCTPPPPPKSRR